MQDLASPSQNPKTFLEQSHNVIATIAMFITWWCILSARRHIILWTNPRFFPAPVMNPKPLNIALVN